jgi:RimJ/RimL family protein N-acetyltransferase
VSDPVLVTERVVLRRPAPGDWPNFRDFMLSPRAAHLPAQGHEGRAFRAFAAELGHWQIRGHGMFAVVPRGGHHASALVGPWTPPDWPEPEIAWMVLDAGLEGTGLAREAAEAALGHVWETLGWTTAVSTIAPGNHRSIRLAERLGARLDPVARAPEAPGPLLVYRHPRPERAAA